MPDLSAADPARQPAPAPEDRPEAFSALREHRYAERDPAAAADVIDRARDLTRALRRTLSRPPREPLDPVPELLGRLGVTPLRYETRPRRMTFAVDAGLSFPSVPEGYGFKGGVARKALAHALRINAYTLPVRDIDLLRTAGTDASRDAELGERYMPDDLTLGEFGVEVLDDADTYLRTRELTVNQVVLLGHEVTASYPALLDTLGATLRVAHFQKQRNRGKTHPGVACKLMRFAAQMRHEGREPLIKPFRLTPREMKFPFAFYFGLHLSRAGEAGAAVAGHYLDFCRERGYVERAGLPANGDARTCAAVLHERLREYAVDFPNLVP